MKETKFRGVIMKTKRHHPIALLTLVILASSPATFAQYRDSLGQPWGNQTAATMSTMIWGKINEMTMYGAATRRSSGSSRKSTGAQTQPEVVPAYRLYPPVRFKSTGTRLKLLDLADYLGTNPQEKVEIKRVLTDILNKFDAAAKAKGYPNDVALAAVSYIGLNSHVYQLKSEELLLPFEQNIGLRDVFAEEAVDNKMFDGMTDREKQEIYEDLVMTGGITYYFYEEARKKNSSQDLKVCKLLAERNLKLIGINP